MQKTVALVGENQNIQAPTFRVMPACIVLLLIGPLFVCFTATAADADSMSMRDQVNRGTVGIVSGGVNGTYIRISADMAAVLDGEQLRLLSILGKGSVQNILDLLYLRGIDIAIVQSDVLEFLKRQGTYGQIDRHIQYITKLYNEELHLLAGEEITSIQQLRGKKVNIDNVGSGTAMTAALVLETLGLEVEVTNLDQSLALAKLRDKEIDALFYVAGQPAQLFSGIEAESGLHFIDIDYGEALQSTYLPARLEQESYPTLIRSESPVRTIAVGAVMAVYYWKPLQYRYEKTANFVQAFFDRFDEFKLPGRHPKWKEVTLAAQVPGWTRFRPADEWLNSSSTPAE